ncbi:MAG: hypothetical protein K8I30_16455 [Anaerolineae bacterium]|jgi:hypothetical protein|nr:hypothetical protein [Anaerolineae bacterium]RIK61651.1 MAG: hypothetical protein DCC65_18590 [Planctomycetota bacterium]
MSMKAKQKNCGLMDWIDDKTVFKAVMFARNLIGKGLSPATANYRAANYYRVSVSEVARYVGQHASRTRLARQRGRA